MPFEKSLVYTFACWDRRHNNNNLYEKSWCRICTSDTNR